MSDTYRIVRFYRSDRPREVVKTGLTLEQAQAWCQDPATSYRNAVGDVTAFDGYEAEA